MANVQLSIDKMEAGNIWLRHVLQPLAYGGDSADVFGWNYSELEFDEPQIRGYYKIILEAIAHRNWYNINDSDAVDIDDILAKVSSIEFSDRPLGSISGGKRYKLSPWEICVTLVNVNLHLGLYWDDTKRTVQECQYFKKTTLGKAVFELECTISGTDPTVSRAGGGSAASSGAGAPRGNGSLIFTIPAGTKWSQLGALSDKAQGLASQPHQKTNLNEEYKIIDDAVTQAKGKECRAIVRPFHVAYVTNNILHAAISTGNNVGEFPVYFNDFNSAKDFMDKVVANGYTGQLSVVGPKPAKPNGYFLFNTNCGQAYVRANLLNEYLHEGVIDEADNDEDDIINQSSDFIDRMDAEDAQAAAANIGAEIEATAVAAENADYSDLKTEEPEDIVDEAYEQEVWQRRNSLSDSEFSEAFDKFLG